MDNRAALIAFGESLAARGSPQTQTRYLRACESLIAAAGELSLAQLTRYDLQRALAKLHAQGLSPRTLAVTLSAWRTWFRYLSKTDAAISSTVFIGIKAPKAAKRLPNALSEVDAVRLVTLPTQHDATKSPWAEARDQAMFEVLYGCGIRVGELIGVDLADLDLDSHEMRVFGKGRKQRVVPLGRPALISIQSWLEQRVTGIAATDTNALFLGARGERISAPVVRKALKARALLQGITSNVYPHRLRHSFASHLLQASGDLRAVQELMGHASIASTQVYTHLDFQHLAKVYDQAHPRARARTQKK
ncbi:MAG: tyrosine recombinase XerC [Rhizobacter sp.]|nr:tyrosine recombinase XerC [Burkholderiales bacterium]